MLKEAKTDDIMVPSDRVRQEFDKKKLNSLAFSFQKFGQIQPGVCVEGPDGKFILVAGERRLRACRIAGIPFTFVLREEANPLLLKEIEVEENLNRINLSWLEECYAMEMLHELRQEQRKTTVGGKQTMEDTAEELEVSRSALQRDLDMARWAKSFQEVRDAKTRAEAEKIVKRYKGEVIRQKMLEEATGAAADSTARTQEAPEKAKDAPTKVLVGEREVEHEYVLEVDRRVIHGRMEERLEDFKDGSSHLVLFDPPWGVGLDEVRRKGGGTSDFSDSYAEVWANMEGWLRILYDKMAEESHLYVFFGIVFHQAIHELLEKVGFDTNWIPLIWYKQGAHVTRNPETWPGRSYEPIAYARKGNKPLIKRGAPDIIITPAPTPSMKKSQPTAKHPDVYLELLKRSAEPGETVLDPMCGSGMVGVACEVLRHTHKLDWWMIEEKKEFRDLSVMNVLMGYSTLVERDRTEEGRQYNGWAGEHSTEDFKELEPGTDRWKRYWREHPEQQEEMLAWRNK